MKSNDRAESYTEFLDQNQEIFNIHEQLLFNKI